MFKKAIKVIISQSFNNQKIIIENNFIFLAINVAKGSYIIFTRVVVTPALLGHQISHSQNRFFPPSCTIYYFEFDI